MRATIIGFAVLVCLAGCGGPSAKALKTASVGQADDCGYCLPRGASCDGALSECCCSLGCVEYLDPYGQAYALCD